jgi:glycerol-3-phosphate dehydrogenase
VALNTFDLIIIGAGINGAGIARDAAMRGLSILVLDKGDISAGTSSWSTRLIHGGLRYLEHGEFGLVRESLHERETLLKIAPHLVRPLPIIIPIYKDGRRGRLTIRAGMIAYDLLSLGKTLPRHHFYSKEETLQQLPELNREGLLGSAKYYDAQVEFAERLVLENILSARDHGAEVMSYARVTGIRETEYKLLEVDYTSHAGSHHAAAKIVINCAGPWVDQLLEGVAGKSSRLIGGTKGSHLVVGRFRGAPLSAIYLEAKSDGRPFFIIPWNGNYLIGTTDIRFEGDLDQVRCEDWEIDYLLAETNRVFPNAGLHHEQVFYTYAGVRPLPQVNEKDEAGITRRHFIREHPQLGNLLSIVGGKLTTYRSLAEECVDKVLVKLGRDAIPCPTKTTLPGASGPINDHNFPSRISERLSRIYGSRVSEIAKLCAETPELGRVFNRSGDAIAAEVVFSFESELAHSLNDCFMRRTMLGLNSDLGRGDVEAAANIAREFLGWSDERARQEVDDYREYVNRFRLLATDEHG